MKKYQLIVVGGGPGGYTAAFRAAELGMSVAIVDDNDLGGVCLNWGCIPTTVSYTHLTLPTTYHV